MASGLQTYRAWLSHPILRRWPPIAKPRTAWRVEPNLTDYDAARRAFTWDEARRQLAGLPGGGLNIAYEAVDRHATGALASRVALRCLARDGSATDITYAELRDLTNRCANALAGLGVRRGDVVVTLAGRIPELYVAALGALKLGAIFSPFFSAFGPEPIKARMNLAGARALITTETLFRRKVAPHLAEMPTLEHVLLVGDRGTPTREPGTKDFGELLGAASPEATIAKTDPDTPALLHFTSGTTGLPKGALHVHEAVVAHHATARFALDLHPDDIFWCTADPGWVTGTSYGIIAPLTHGVTSIVDDGDFDAERWYRIVSAQRVSVWYTAPTAIRMMMRAGSALARQYTFPDLRFLASVGEPLNPEAVMWGIEAFGLPFHDNWWQTETGGIMVANYAASEIRPGSMGRPLPGIEATLVRRRPDGGVDEVTEPDVQGELALRRGWPSMFRGYWHDEARYAKCFAGDYYLTGDLAARDADGYFWFVGRADDVIKSSGHLIGPFEVESALLEHPAVAEAGVIGKPDPVAFEIVKAFVSLKPGHDATEDLRQELLGFARVRLGAAVAPKEIAFVDAVPKNRAGKIMRRLLKARELGSARGRHLHPGAIMTTESPVAADGIDVGHARHLLREMLRIRRFEEKCAELYSAGQIRGFLHLYIGEEAVAVGVMQALTPDDAIVATYREHGHALARGIPSTALMAEMYGKQEGCSRGRGGSMHIFDAATRFYGGNAIVGGGLPMAVGLALADTLQGRQRVTACVFGDGAVAEGEFHESMNLAALWRLPVLFLCENNLYAMGTPIDRSLADIEVHLKAQAYAMPAASVDGMDVFAVEEATRAAADAVRRGEGPWLLEFRTYRFRAHSMFDPELYRDKAEVETWKQRDPIALVRARLASEAASAPGAADLDEDVAAEIDAAVAFAEAGTWEPVEDLTKDVYAP